MLEDGESGGKLVGGESDDGWLVLAGADRFSEKDSDLLVAYLDL